MLLSPRGGAIGIQSQLLRHQTVINGDVDVLGIGASRRHGDVAVAVDVAADVAVAV